MPEDPKQPQPDGQAEVAEYLRRNRQVALDMIRGLKCHCMLYVPGPLTPKEVRALIYTELSGLAELYKPKTEVD